MDSSKQVHELEIAEREEAVAKREAFEENIKNIWGHSSLGIEAKRAAMSMLSTKTGLYAKVPISCKEATCPYANTCILLEHGLAPRGEKCPMETAMIETRYAGYETDYDLDSASFTDSTIVAEIINLDVTMERCKALLAANFTPVEEVVAGMTEDGQTFTRPEVSKAWEIYERASNKRDKLLDMMNGTRKANKGAQEQTTNIHDILAGVYEQDFVVEERPEQYKDL